MKALLISIFFLISPSFSYGKTVSNLSSSDTSPLTVKAKLIIDALKSEIGWTDNSDGVKKSPLKKATPEPKTKGQSAIDKIRAKNRALLKKDLGENFAKQRGADVIRQKMAENRTKLNSSYDDGGVPEIAEKNRAFLKQLRIQNKDALKHWQNVLDETQKYWDGKKREFLVNLKYYKQNLVEFKKENDVTHKDLNKPLKKNIDEIFHVIPGAVDVPIRDQGRRPTCSAFAGIRAVETLLSSHHMNRDFSEQYLYWSSKPNCQSTPCTEKGSWVRQGFEHSSQSSSYDIPLESSCPYIPKSKSGNETQLPIGQGCRQGKVKVNSYTAVKSLDDIYSALKQNKPVVGAFKLSPNFYKNNGLITHKDSLQSGGMDAHSLGHAFLIIGHIKLPDSLRDEGKICLLIANSWGEGWGKGGFSCITEKWIKKYRAPNAFIALESLTI